MAANKRELPQMSRFNGLLLPPTPILYHTTKMKCTQILYFKLIWNSELLKMKKTKKRNLTSV